MKTPFSGYQIASLARIASPKFNVRINKAGNIAIEPSVVTNTNVRKYIFYKTAEGFVIRSGRTDDKGQHNYTRLAKTINGERQYTFATFAEAFGHFKKTIARVA